MQSLSQVFSKYLPGARHHPKKWMVPGTWIFFAEVVSIKGSAGYKNDQHV